MALTERSLAWLRAAHLALPSTEGISVADVESIAEQVPAWIEPCVVLHRHFTGDPGEVDWVDDRFDCPQIVDVDLPAMAFDRAEWIGSSLYLGLAPLHPDPKVYTTFRIVGVEPRQWDVAGVDGAMVDAKTGGTVVRVPLVKATMSFTPSSY